MKTFQYKAILSKKIYILWEIENYDFHPLLHSYNLSYIGADKVTKQPFVVISSVASPKIQPAM